MVLNPMAMNAIYFWIEDETVSSRKTVFMTILCQLGCVIPNIRVNLDLSF